MVCDVFIVLIIFFCFFCYLGVGFVSMMVFFFVCVYYNIIIVWCFYFFFLLFRKDVFWKSCGNWWNSEKCYVGRILECFFGFFNGIVVFVNSIVVFVNLIFKNCIKVVVDDFFFLVLEYW